MRKRIGVCLLAALLLATLMVPALAAPSGDTPGIYDLKAETGYTVTPVKKDGGAITAADGFFANAEKLTVTVTGAKADTFYLVTAQKDKELPTTGNLVYIDQQTGPATFNVYPSAMENGKSYYIFIASNETSGALKQIASFIYYGGKTAPEGTMGDVDGKRGVNAQDAMLVAKYAAAQRAGKSQAELDKIIAPDYVPFADVDGKRGINAQDAMKIAKYAAAQRAGKSQAELDKIFS